MITGFGSASAVGSIHLASDGVAGAITLRPGTWANQPSRLWECCAASWRPAPVVVRTTNGTLNWPPDMCSSVAAVFTS